MAENLKTSLRSGAVPKVPEVRHRQLTATSAPMPVLDSSVEKTAGCDAGPSGGGGSKAMKGPFSRQDTTEISAYLQGAGQQKLPDKTMKARSGMLELI